MSVFALVDPEGARRRRDLVVEVARAGDFAVTDDDTAARVSMVIAAFADIDRSPMANELAELPYPAVTATLYRELLARVPELLDHVDRYAELWRDEDGQRRRDAALLRSGRVTIDEVPELDLTVVTLPPDERSAGGHRFGGMWHGTVHPLALHAAIRGFTVLLVQGPSIELRYRYESWVQYQSRPVRPRVDLTPLAAELTALEPGSTQWTFDGADALTPALHTVDGAPSDLDPGDVRALVEDALRLLPRAFDPYDVPAIG
jgi:hypothetical protein